MICLCNVKFAQRKKKWMVNSILLPQGSGESWPTLRRVKTSVQHNVFVVHNSNYAHPPATWNKTLKNSFWFCENCFTLFFIWTHFIRTSKLRLGKKIRTNKNKVKLGLCSVRYRFRFRFRETKFRGTADLYLGKFLKISFFPFWNGKFPAFSTGQVWSNCQVYKLQFIRTWMNKNRNKNTWGSNWQKR